METKTHLVRRLVSSGEYKKALQICKDWNYDNKNYRGSLSRGYECLMYPKFYSQLGYNPDEEYQKAVDILLSVYL